MMIKLLYDYGDDELLYNYDDDELLYHYVDDELLYYCCCIKICIRVYKYSINMLKNM